MSANSAKRSGIQIGRLEFSKPLRLQGHGLFAERLPTLPQSTSPATVNIAANGRQNASLALPLPANALVKNITLIITANRSRLIKATDVADIRQTKNGLVIDFGTMRTISGLLLPFRTSGHSARIWLGSQFDSQPIQVDPGGDAPIGRPERQGTDKLPFDYQLHSYPLAEIRTERLLLKLTSTPSDVDAFINQMELQLPELPANLELRINGGPPVWHHPDTIQLGSNVELSEDNWNSQGQRLLDITDHLLPLTGDATNNQLQTLALELASSVPGDLQLALATSQYQLLHRLTFNDREALTLAFIHEGQQQLDLPAPVDHSGPKNVKGVRLTIAGTPPPERILPPTGPMPSGVGELSLGNGRAACLRLDGGEGLSQIIGLRLPLIATSGSAEARIILWDSENGLPRQASEVASKPVSWENSQEQIQQALNQQSQSQQSQNQQNESQPGEPQQSQWLSFLFDEPQPYDPADPPWAALVVSRGEINWSLTAWSEHGPAPLRPAPLRIGGPQGPWRLLPGIFGQTTQVGQASSRFRLIGLAPEEQPLPSLLLELDEGQSQQQFTPDEKGLRIQLDSNINSSGNSSGNSSSANGTLQLISRSPVNLDLTDIDVITDA